MTDSQRLIDWGWTADRNQDLPEETSPPRVAARVIAQHRGEYRLMTAFGEAVGVAPGRMLYRALGRRELPAVGDWVLIEPARDGPAAVVEILPRRTQFIRRRAGNEGGDQVIAANVDLVWIVSSLNLELNPRKIERYLVAARDSGALPVIVLTKSDLCVEIEQAVESVREVVSDAPIEVVSSLDGDGIDALRAWLEPARTVAIIGSSGVGKSTLVNTLAGDTLMVTQDVRDDDDKGRHTTTHREIFRLPGGALLLDTPGMREFGLVEAEEGLGETFDDVDELVAQCRFRDCAHGAEPGCAVRAAVEAGTLSTERWASYEKLQKEATYELRRRDVSADLAEKRRWKQIHKDYRNRPNKKA